MIHEGGCVARLAAGQGGREGATAAVGSQINHCCKSPPARPAEWSGGSAAGPSARHPWDGNRWRRRSL